VKLHNFTYELLRLGYLSKFWWVFISNCKKSRRLDLNRTTGHNASFRILSIQHAYHPSPPCNSVVHIKFKKYHIRQEGLFCETAITNTIFPWITQGWSSTRIWSCQQDRVADVSRNRAISLATFTPFWSQGWLLLLCEDFRDIVLKYPLCPALPTYQ